MDRFLEDAAGLLESAEAAARSGEAKDFTIVLGPAGVRMTADCDWPIESLRSHEGARTVYRLTTHAGRVRIEGAEHGRTCRLESQPTARLERLLPASFPQYEIAAPQPALLSASSVRYSSAH